MTCIVHFSYDMHFNSIGNPWLFRYTFSMSPFNRAMKIISFAKLFNKVDIRDVYIKLSKSNHRTTFFNAKILNHLIINTIQCYVMWAGTQCSDFFQTRFILSI